MKTSVSFDDALWVVVPREPTKVMFDAGWEMSSISPKDIYRAMLAAAPSPPSAQAEAEAVGDLDEGDLSQALGHVEALCTFAYDQGFHELGYDPVAMLRTAINTALRLAPSAKAEAAKLRDGLSLLEDEIACGEMSGAAVLTRVRSWFDLSATTPVAPPAGRQSVEGDVMQLRAEMQAEGWGSEDRITKMGWGDFFGYSIWFERWDWHGVRTAVLIGTKACYHAHTPDPSKAIKAVRKAAELARVAYAMYKEAPPQQMADDSLQPHSARASRGGA